MPAALLLIDLQNDFLPGGALAVPEGEAVIAVANRVQPLFDLIVATQDWHPPEHGSFAANHAGKRPGDVIELAGLPQVLWPTHCVQDSPGAAFAPGLDRQRWAPVTRKGCHPQIDSYSGFYDNGGQHSTGLAEFLTSRGVTDVYLLGVATDFCVKFTALDALRAGFRAHLIVDGCRGVNLQPGDVDRALAEMRQAGVEILTSGDLLTPPPEVLHETRFLRLVRRGHWVYAQRPNVTGVVCIAAVTPEQKLLLVEQFRIPVGTTVIELPAGLAGDEPGQASEPLAAAARRELLEETGYEAAELEELVYTTASAGMTDEGATLFLAHGLQQSTAGGGVAGERIVVHEVPLTEVDAWLRQRQAHGALVDARVYSGLYFLRQR